MSKRNDLVGKRFGILTVIEYVGKNKYKCRCDCGNTCTVFATNLVRNHSQSCGCAKKNDITGKRFGMLTAVERIMPRGKYQYWKCICDCGNECEARQDVLVRGDKTSCGCINLTKDIPPKLREEFFEGTQICKLNPSLSKANKSGFVGVNFDKSRNKWMAGIKFKGKRYNLGRYNTVGEAAAIREIAEKKIYGEFLEWYEQTKKEDEIEAEKNSEVKKDAE